MKGYQATLFLCTTIFLLFWYVDAYEAGAEETVRPPAEYGKIITQIDKDQAGLSETILFLGDVMLARDVESKMKTFGVDYPFSGTKEVMNSRYVVGNFESAMSEYHRQTANGAMRFSTSVGSLAGLVNSRVTHLSLANNHTFDYGQSGFDYTANQLELRNIDFFGHPYGLATSSVSFFELEGLDVALIGINSTNGAIDESNLENVISYAGENSNLQIAYVHWGDEYKNLSNTSQQKLARELIDKGVDLVVGHHPHVVQEIESYNDKLIFFSLGNFIFDQYFSEEVQTGLMLRLGISTSKKSGYIDLLPATSLDSRAQPRLILEEGKENFLYELAGKSRVTDSGSIHNGVLTFSLD